MKSANIFNQTLVQIFFPRSITRESGYRAKIFSPQFHEKVPIPISPVQDNHEPPSPKHYVPGSPTSGVRMGTFRSPTEPLKDLQIHTIYTTESQAGHYRRSTENDSLECESDADSFVIASPTTPHVMEEHHPQRRFHQQSRQDSSQTASGGRSDDTMWERQDDSLPNRRRHSDGVYNRHRIIVAAIPGSPASEEGHWSTDHEREAGRSQLHPFVSST